MRRRIIICLALLLALCLIGDAIAMLCLNSSIHQLTGLAESHRIQSLRAELTSGGVRIERDVLASLGPPTHIHDSAERLDSIDRFARSLSACSRCHRQHSSSIQTRLDAIGDTFEAYRESMQRVIASGDVTTVALDQETRDLAHRLVRQSTVISDEAAEHLAVRGEDAAASIHRAWLVLCGTLAAALLLGGFVAYYLKRRMTVPLEALLEGIERIRRGDLNYRFSIDGDDEFRTLGHAFNRANESLQSAHDSILQAEKMAAVGKLATGVAHEVCNPLASISSIAQMMRRDCTTDEQTERIDLIMQHIARVSRIVRELLTFSRPADDQRQGPIEINALLDHTMSLLRYDKRAGRTLLTCQCEDNLTMARGDADRLLLVFTNIMINAFDALADHADGDARLAITARRQGDRIVIRFEDNGPGMTEEQIGNAFEPFFTTKDPGAGTGLGLWICYQVISKHHGNIRIDSQVGQGTTVVIELPREAPSTDADAPAQSAGQGQAPSPVSSQS